jgi:hypothetical protein
VTGPVAADRKLPLAQVRRRMETAARRITVWEVSFESYASRKEFLPPHMALTALEDIRAALAGELR